MWDRRAAARSPATWGLALVLMCAIDAGLTRTSLLWGESAFHRPEGAGLVFAQAFLTARRLYHPEPPAGIRIAVLGNSRILLAANEDRLRADLQVALSREDVRVDMLGAFAADPNLLYVISKMLWRVDPTLVVVTLSASDLLLSPRDPIRTTPARLLATGWEDGPIRADGGAALWSERLDRWGRTVWPLFRFREFVRVSLEDRILRRTVRPVPQPPTDRLDLFERLRPGRGEAIEDDFRLWQAERDLDSFLRYMKSSNPGHLADVENRTREADPALIAENLGVLNALFGVLEPRHAIVVVMPEHPILLSDRSARYHVPGLSDSGTAAITAEATRHSLRTVDARGWMPADEFVDIDHLMPGLSGFETRLSREIADELGS